MKIYISGANPSNENYNSAIEYLQYRLSELGFNVSIGTKNLISSYRKLLQSDYAYFIDGWFDIPRCRRAFETCHNHGIPVLFESPKPYYKEYAKTFELVTAINKIMGVSLKEMRTLDKHENTFFARTIFSWVCKEHYNIRVRDIAKMLNKNHSSVIRQIEMFDILSKSPGNKGFNKMCDDIFNEMSENKKKWDYKSDNTSYEDCWTAGDNLYCELENMDWQDAFGLPGCPNITGV